MTGEPLTWGQRAIWAAIERTAPDDRYFNFGRVLAVPRSVQPLSVADVRRAVGLLTDRHEALRTTIGPGPAQIIGEAAEPVVGIVHAARGEEAAVAAELRARMESAAFDYREERPLRTGVVICDGTVSHVVLVFCHMAADGLGAEVALRDLRLLLLRGEAGGPPPSQPAALARWQNSAEGLRLARAADEYWEREFSRIPVSMFPTQVADPSGPPIWRALLTSRAAAMAAQRLAVLHGATTGAVLLAASAAMVGRITGQGLCAMLPIVGNRFRADTRNAVTTLSQEGLFVCDVTAERFEDLLRVARPAALRAYRHAYHDPAGRAAATARASDARGAEIQPYCCFNDMRFAEHPPRAWEAAEIDAALGSSTLTWPISQERLNCRFCVHITGEGANLGISVTADTRYLPKAGMESWLRGLEDLLVEAAVRAAAREVHAG
ncbi:non-ribosomal peptide synthetase condensation domain protein [Spongiactinospora rosea]|uniref:Non-ribosomal peptide synthetase condensation domain protein n=1 Tax=Spongiactinospora rosea TaxID=2248750 RepID=A0A366LNK6_9ACTN|nr:condensation domain-containing protein [Spongiactinospora rosea]RBQ14742.1 non-ribosomal peptide synthetase condensation domain protein [Spongiactinospora rosea]